MIPFLLAAALVVLPPAAATLAAEQTRVDHRDPGYPPGFFDTLTNGTPVEGRPGWVWQHDGVGWTQVDTTTPTAGPNPAPTFRTFKLGRTYARNTGATDGNTRLFIAAAGQLPDGTPVIFTLCLAGCGGVPVRVLPLVHSQDWLEEPVGPVVAPTLSNTP